MPIMLSHLGVRRPTLEDFHSIAELVAACDMAEDWMAERSTHDLAFRWQRDDFHLESDAWVITNGRRQFAGFACVWLSNVHAS